MCKQTKNSEAVYITPAQKKLLDTVSSVGNDFINESLMKIHDIVIYHSGDTALERKEKEYLYRVKELADIILEIEL